MTRSCLLPLVRSLTSLRVSACESLVWLLQAEFVEMIKDLMRLGVDPREEEGFDAAYINSLVDVDLIKEEAKAEASAALVSAEEDALEDPLKKRRRVAEVASL